MSKQAFGNPREKRLGIPCPNCQSRRAKVIDSRPNRKHGPPETAIRRRKVCLDCEYRFTTYERLEEDALLEHEKSLRELWLTALRCLREIRLRTDDSLTLEELEHDEEEKPIHESESETKTDSDSW